jgi:hypothetical protein
MTGALARLVQFYEETDKPEEAARWRTELEAARVGPESAASRIGNRTLEGGRRHVVRRSGPGDSRCRTRRSAESAI